MNYQLYIENVSKTYNDNTPALKNISLSIRKGEFITIIGPSGAGKSTLLRVINRLVPVDRGSILYDNKDIVTMKKRHLPSLRRQIGMVFQSYNLIPTLTVLENVLHGRLGYKSTITGLLGLYSSAEKEQAIRLLHQLGLENQINKRCDQLSGGQMQRVGIARALIQNPNLLLCDEPIASLDPTSSKVIMNHLQSINKEMGITCLLSLHHVAFALEYSHRIIGLKNGLILYDGSPQHLTSEKLQKLYGMEYSDLASPLEAIL